MTRTGSPAATRHHSRTPSRLILAIAAGAAAGSIAAAQATAARAGEAMHAGTPTIRVELTARHAADRPAHLLPSVFDPGTRPAPWPVYPPRLVTTESHHAARNPAPARPYLIYDSVIPAAIPPHRTIATYSDGPFAAAPSTVAGRGRILWIDVNGTNPAASAVDVEPGDVTPAGAASWVSARLTKNPHATAIVYTMQSWWPAVTAGIDALPSWMRHHVRYWIADPTGYPHILPGATATQWYWGPDYDISSAYPGLWR